MISRKCRVSYNITNQNTIASATPKLTDDAKGEKKSFFFAQEQVDPSIFFAPLSSFRLSFCPSSTTIVGG